MEFDPIPEEIHRTSAGRSRNRDHEGSERSHEKRSDKHHGKERKSRKERSSRSSKADSESSHHRRHHSESHKSSSSGSAKSEGKTKISHEPLINLNSGDHLDFPELMPTAETNNVKAKPTHHKEKHRKSKSGAKENAEGEKAPQNTSEQQQNKTQEDEPKLLQKAVQKRLDHAGNPTSKASTHVEVSTSSVTPCKKHPSDYFSQLLSEKKTDKSSNKLHQLWPKHWGSFNDQPERDSLDGNLPNATLDQDKPKIGLIKEKGAGSTTGFPSTNLDPPTFDGSLDPPLPGSKSLAHSTRSIMKSGSWSSEREPFTHLWVALSSMYGKLLVVLMLAFCLTEVMDNSIAPFTFQGIYMIYLYVGSIIAIMCIYISLLIDQCPSLTKSRENLTSADAESGSIRSFDSLKRAHISRSKTPRTSFYLRVGALGTWVQGYILLSFTSYILVFGLATLVFNGLEIAMHSTMEGKCVAEVIFAHPILQALFTFLQMHFLFVNSEVLVEKFGLLARFGFMHLIATNVSLWIRTVVWESANEWLHYLHYQQIQAGTGIGVVPVALKQFATGRNTYVGYQDYGDFEDDDIPAANSIDYITAPVAEASMCNSSLEMISQSHIRNMVGLYECFNNNTLGKVWSSSMPYLFPFLVEYNLIAAAVAYIMWRSVGQLKKNGVFQSRLHKQLTVPDDINNTLDPHRPKGHWRVDCQGASKGLFMGLLSLVSGIIVLIIFFVMKDNLEFRPDLFWLCMGTQVTLLSLAIIMTGIGFVQLPKLSLSLHKPLHLDVLLANITTYGVFIYGIFGVIVGGTNLTDSKHIMLFMCNGLLIIQATMQGMFIAESSKRVCTSRYQMLFKPGRQIVTFLLFANITLWLLDTFMSHNWMTQELQFSFYGFLAWGIVSRLSLPLLVFYRFHSAVVLIEIWKNTYRTKDV